MNIQTDRVLNNLLAITSLCTTLFLFLPLTVYSLNLHCVTTKVQTLLQGGLIISAATSLLLFLLTSVPILGSVCRATCQIAAITVFVLVVFPNRTGEITGFETSKAVEGWLPYVKLFGLVAVGIFIAWRWPKHLRSAAHIALLLAALVSGYILIFQSSSLGAGVSEEEEERYLAAALGKEANIIVIVADTFTGYRMVEVFDERPELREGFAGFTLYPRAVASANNTPAGISAILTGDLDVSVKIEDGLRRNTESLSRSFLQDAVRNGFDAVYVSDQTTEPTEISTYRDHYFITTRNEEGNGRLGEYLNFWLASLMRIVPQPAHKHTKILMKRIVRSLSLDNVPNFEVYLSTPLEQYLYFGSKLVIEYFINNLHIGDSLKKAIFLHSKMGHSPFVFDEDGRYSPRSSHGTSIFVTKTLVRLLDKIRQLGVYENSLIIVVADHGGMSVKDKSMGGVFDEENALVKEFNPLLMVKPPNARHSLVQSEMSVWLGDVYETVRDYLGMGPSVGKEITSLSLMQPAHNKTRELNVPLFFQPDQVSWHSHLGNFVRRDVRGKFADYGRVSSEDPVERLRSGAEVTLFAGVDKLWTGLVESGLIAGKGARYRGVIEVDRLIASKITNPGIIAVREAKDGFKISEFASVDEEIRFMQGSPAGTSLLAVGLHVPISAIRILFPDVKLDNLDPEKVKHLNFVYAARGPGEKRILDMGAGDVGITLRWE